MRALQGFFLLQKRFYFDDGYYPSGSPAGHGIAIIATGQYLSALTLDGNSTLSDQIRESIYNVQLYD